ncbi:hypothetical protein EAM_0884 [Erwinia amylovora ATCC 49946]|nr:hypothetical protein EAM_0884 [Erwinia amylovora ATCC 49946]
MIFCFLSQVITRDKAFIRASFFSPVISHYSSINPPSFHDNRMIGFGNQDA